jgi:hypothetical protein
VEKQLCLLRGVCYGETFTFYVFSRAVKLNGYIGSTCRTNGVVKKLNILEKFKRLEDFEDFA